MKIELDFQTGTPPCSGQYVVVCILDGERIVAEGSWDGTWTVQQFQVEDPHWGDLRANVIKWAEFPWSEFDDQIGVVFLTLLQYNVYIESKQRDTYAC